MFGWLINRIQRRESAGRLLAATARQVAHAQRASEAASEHLRSSISTRRAATEALQRTLDETLERVRRRT